MARQKKGFDPLSTLFTVPDPAAGVPLPLLDDEPTIPSTPGLVEITDPLLKHPPIDESITRETTANRRIHARQRAPEVPPDPVAIAKAIGKAAAERAKVEPQPTPRVPPSDIDLDEIEIDDFEDDAPEVSVPAPEPPAPEPPAPEPPAPEPPAPEPPAPEPPALAPAAPAQPDPVAIARAVGRAAAERARASAPGAPKVASSPKGVAPGEPKAPPAPQAAPAAAGRKPSRLDSLAARAQRPQNALEAARAAAAAEASTKKAAAESAAQNKEAAAQSAAQNKKAAAQSAAQSADEQSRKAAASRKPARAAEPTPRPADASDPAAQTHLVSELAVQVGRLIPRWLPGVRSTVVANAIVIDQREVLTALWKAHRAKFSKDGELERAVGAAAVLHALEATPEGMLVAAHVMTEASDYLVWLDLQHQYLVAAFADARSYFA